MVKNAGLLFLAVSFTSAAPPLRVTTHLVEVHVVVHDKAGHAVPGLTRDDFILKDRGQVQKIGVFSLESRRSPAPTDTPLPPGVFSNLAAAGKTPLHSATVILLDKLNARYREQDDVRTALLRFLERFEPQEPVALVSFGEDHRLRVLSDFTTRPEQLRAAAAADQPKFSNIQRMSEMDPMDNGDADRKEMTGPLADLGRMVAEYATEAKVGRTLQVLEAIARKLANVPGRKSLIWFSDTFPLNLPFDAEDVMNWRLLRIDFEEQVEWAMRVVTDANVAVYPVDSRGLLGVAGVQAEDLEDAFGMKGASLAPSVKQAYMTMQTVAEATGGRAFYGRNDLEGSLREAFDDGSLVYILGYQPQHDEWDGKFRRIEVRVKREGLKVRCRRGYFAYADEPEPQRQASLLEALNSPLEATAIGLFGSLVPGKLRLTVDLRHITLAEREDHWKGALDMLFAQEDATGRRLETKQISAPLDWSQADFERRLREGARFNREIALQPSAVRLRIVVRDRPSGALGSLSLPVER